VRPFGGPAARASIGSKARILGVRPDGGAVVWADESGSSITVRHLTRPARDVKLAGQGGGSDYLYAADGRAVFSVGAPPGKTGYLFGWDADTGLRLFPPLPSGSDRVVESPDGRTLVGRVS
jgi:hypothetical protein